MPSRALNYVKRKGIVTEEEYPYTAVQGTCNPPREGTKVTGHKAVGASETDLIAAI
jgi:cathepsin L